MRFLEHQTITILLCTCIVYILWNQKKNFVYNYIHFIYMFAM